MLFVVKWHITLLVFCHGTAVIIYNNIICLCLHTLKVYING